MSVKDIIDNILKLEGGYVYDEKDSGGETNFGITISVARQNGYTGPMKEMPRAVAYDIYYKQYVKGPGFDKVMVLSEAIAEELIDTGVNMGVSVSSKFLQRCLNVLNNEGSFYSDLVVDGKLGINSISALNTYLTRRGDEGEKVLLRALNCLQGVFYIELAERRQKDKRFVYGWLKNRVV